MNVSGCTSGETGRGQKGVKAIKHAILVLEYLFVDLPAQNNACVNTDPYSYLMSISILHPLCCYDDTAQGMYTIRPLFHRLLLTRFNQTMLNCIDNSGASIVECVANLRMKRHAKIGAIPIYDAPTQSH